VRSAGALLQEPFEAPAEGMLLEATGGETRATGAVARRIGALRPELRAAMAAGVGIPRWGSGSWILRHWGRRPGQRNGCANDRCCCCCCCCCCWRRTWCIWWWWWCLVWRTVEKCIRLFMPNRYHCPLSDITTISGTRFRAYFKAHFSTAIGSSPTIL
jgi:hypothetical protein